jgi:uncharacterized membrane protein
MAALIGLFVGAFVGHMLWRDWGAALGGVAGFIIGAKLAALRRTTAARSTTSSPIPAPPPPPTLPGAVDREHALLSRIAELERRVAHLEQARAGAVGTEPFVAPRSAAEPFVAPRSAAEPFVAPQSAAEAAPLASTTTPPTLAATTDSPMESAAPVIEREPARARVEPPPLRASPAVPRANPVWTWFTGGNALTRIGVVVLFFGVAFLLRYFAEHFAFPIELRLAAVAACGHALIALGTWLARSRPGYGLSLQGAGAGILYLTIYAAFRLYGVLPQMPAVALLVVVSAVTVWLAVRNDSQPLAALAIAGGFLAPMLVAEGGEPLQLFGYFAVLNGAIFALAWTRAWRGLNAVGFVFTFALAAFWGHGFYRPEHYAVVQPFLVLFFGFYVAIAILYARRGPLAAKDPVDALLVFGVPIVGFALQAALVRDLRYGAAWSAVAMAAIYLALFAALRRRVEPGFPLLSRAFLALAIIFATIAVPFAFDRHATAALWAVEAAGVYWIGVRQRAQLVRGFALATELGAGIVFAASGMARGGDPLFANAFFAGAILIALSALASARIADRAGDAMPAGERYVVHFVFAWGAFWWLGAGAVELGRYLPRLASPHAVLAWVTGSVAASFVLARLLAWPRLRAAASALLPAMALVALADFDRARTTLTVYGWLIWPSAWLVHWQGLRYADVPGFASAESRVSDRDRLLRAAHAASALMLTVQVVWEASEWTGRATEPHTVWTACAAALPAIAFLLLCVRLHGSARWPAQPHRDAYAVAAGGPIAGLLAVWFFVVNAVSPGDPSPLPYVPLANPLDATLALALVALVVWARRFAGIPERALYRWIGAGLFVALNGIVIRAAHHWGDIPWRLTSLLASKPLQAALTLAWTATALALMYAATKRKLRPLWMLGAALLALVVVKLFVVDLGALSGLPRVVAFLGVGALLLVIGFLSPLPPAAPESDRAGDALPRR